MLFLGNLVPIHCLFFLFRLLLLRGKQGNLVHLLQALFLFFLQPISFTLFFHNHRFLLFLSALPIFFLFRVKKQVQDTSASFFNVITLSLSHPIYSSDVFAFALVVLTSCWRQNDFLKGQRVLQTDVFAEDGVIKGEICF
jgi:hypothetical protein